MLLGEGRELALDAGLPILRMWTRRSVQTCICCLAVLDSSQSRQSVHPDVCRTHGRAGDAPDTRSRRSGLSTPASFSVPARPLHTSEKSERDARTGSRLGPVNPEQDHRHAITGRDLDSRNRTVILWRETDLVQGSVERHVVVTLDATSRTAVILTLPQAVELADALRAAAAIR